MAEVANVKSKKREETVKKIIAALDESSGLLTLAAKKAGYSYMTICRYVHDYPAVKDAVTAAKERMLDFTEGKLYEKIKAGDNIAILFYLKTQGKSRGYIERSEVTGAEGTPLLSVNVHSNETKQDIESVLKRLSTN